jgi:hypothetical protein
MGKLPSISEIADAIEIPAERWRNNCHVVSLAAVRSGLLGEPGPACRVVRGWTRGYGIGGQHSWIALGRPFDPGTRIVDLTAHTWGQVEGVVTGTVAQAEKDLFYRDRGHVAHGYEPGSIFGYGRPAPTLPELAHPLDVTELSEEARMFVSMLEPLSVDSWAALMTYPHGGWPAHEICEAVCEQIPRVRVLLPIDVLAHVTDRNPDGLYW